MHPLLFDNSVASVWKCFSSLFNLLLFSHDQNLSRRQHVTAACFLGLLSFSHLLSPFTPFFTLSPLLLRWKFWFQTVPFIYFSFSTLLVFLGGWLVVSLPSERAVALYPLHTHSSLTPYPCLPPRCACFVILFVTLPFFPVFPSYFILHFIPSRSFSHFPPDLQEAALQSTDFSIHCHISVSPSLCVLLFLIPFISFTLSPLSLQLPKDHHSMDATSQCTYSYSFSLFRINSGFPAMFPLCVFCLFPPLPLFLQYWLFIQHISFPLPLCSCLSVLLSLKRWKPSSALFHTGSSWLSSLPHSFSSLLIASFHITPAIPGAFFIF